MASGARQATHNRTIFYTLGSPFLPLFTITPTVQSLFISHLFNHTHAHLGSSHSVESTKQVDLYLFFLPNTKCLPNTCL